MGHYLERKESITTTNAFPKILDESNLKKDEIWIDKGSKSYIRSMKSWLEKNSIEMHSTHTEGKFVAAERFIRSLKNKIYKYMNDFKIKKCICW